SGPPVPAARYFLPPSLADLDPRALHHPAVGDHALGVRGRKPGAHQLEQQLGRKSIREHQRLAAAVRRGGEELKGAATVGLGAAAMAMRGGHGVDGRWWWNGGSRIPRGPSLLDGGYGPDPPGPRRNATSRLAGRSNPSPPSLCSSDQDRQRLTCGHGNRAWTISNSST